MLMLGIRCRCLAGSLWLALLLGWSADGLAWGRFGHEVVGHLAEQELSPAAREAVAGLLDGRSLAEVGAWADEVRPDRPDTAPLHYVNGPTDALRPTDEDFNLEQGNVYSAVLGYAGQLADLDRSQTERGEALKFLVHFVGDLHQPLHAGFAEDRGGNDLAVLYDGEVINLHRYWDHQILKPWEVEFDSEQFAGDLLGRYTAEQRQAWKAEDDPREWVVEARRYLFAGLYPFRRSDIAAEAGAAMPVLDETYQLVWRPVADRQLARAGARLGQALNVIFEQGESPFESSPVAMPEAP